MKCAEVGGAAPMRVLMTADTVGGVWTFAVELARALFEVAGAQTILATMGGQMSPDQRLAAQAVPGLIVADGAHRLEWMPDDPWDDVARAGDWLLGLEREYRPDVVHLNGTLSHGALPWKAPVLLTAHSCVCSWWRAVKGGDAPSAEWGRYRAAVACGLHAADYVTAPTGAMLDALAETYGTPGRAAVVPNGRDPERFRPDGAKETFVLSAGRFWDEAKNVEALLSAARDLPWPVFLAGNQGAEARRRPQNVRLLGQQEPGAMAALMARASVFALPARYEPFGLSALEAGLSGCALVLGDIPSLREVWGDAALFVPPDDPAALREAICCLACCEKRRAEYARRARARARTYTAERMARGYLSLYSDLIAAKSGEGAGRLKRDVLSSLPTLPNFATSPNPAPSPWRLCSAWSEGAG